MSATFQCELTPASVCETVGVARSATSCSSCHPGVFALTDVVLTRSKAHRHALSPPRGLSWPPDHISDRARAVADAGRRWSASVKDNADAIPDLIAAGWDILREAARLPLEHLTERPTGARACRC